ncbi:hypothetical protein ETAA1_52610 [Urbifossiella limnaea]|uniref:Uncharacterized protein n=1 Tax=Urbifossiella limnaea TaxID=2528023 RepID=A0A517Y0H9_9BACT|nr:hypothetical protein ETAA1_52610 [Urbifossiella limnaea]
MEWMREIRTDVEVLVHAISDGINSNIRDVLIPRGLVDPVVYDAGCGAEGDLTRLQYEVAAAVAESWAVSWRNEPT